MSDSDRATRLTGRARNSRGFRTRFVNIPAELDSNAENVPILSSALAAGLYPKLLVIDAATGGMKTITNGQGASIVSRPTVSSTLTRSAPQLCQFPDTEERLRHEPPGVLYTDAVQEAVRLGGRTRG